MTCTSYQIDGISTWRCGSLASNGRPVFVREPAITQLLLSPARAVRSSHSRPGGIAGVSSRALRPIRSVAAHSTGAAVAACGAGAAASRIAGRARRHRPHEQVGLRRSDRAREPPAHELAAAVLGQAPGQQPADRQRVHGGPRLGGHTEQQELRRPLPSAHCRRRGVDSGRVVLERAANLGCGSLPLRCGSTPQSKPEKTAIGGQRRRTEHLRQAAPGRAPVDLHLPQALARVQVPHRCPRIVGVARVDVRDGVGVEQHLHGGREARQAQLPLERRDGPFQEKPAGGAGRDCQHQRQKGKALHPAAAVGLLQRRSCRARKRSARIGSWRDVVTPGQELTRIAPARKAPAARAVSVQTQRSQM